MFIHSRQHSQSLYVNPKVSHLSLSYPYLHLIYELLQQDFYEDLMISLPQTLRDQ